MSEINKNLIQKQSDVPERLYRYMPIDLNTLTALSQNYLWFSHPDTFNDPFDGVVYLDGEYSEKLVKEYLMRVFKERDMSMEMFEPAYDSYLKTPKTQDLFNKSMQASLWETTKDVTKVCCFSKLQKTILMWSHYAKGHTGMCLGYDAKFLTTNTDEEVLPIFKIEYYAKMTRSSFENDQESAIHYAFRHKYDIWSYEEEWRALINKPEHKIYFKPEALKSVTFGCKTPLVQKKTIRNILGSRVNYYKTVMNGNAYELEVEEEDFEEPSMFSQFESQ